MLWSDISDRSHFGSNFVIVPFRVTMTVGSVSNTIPGILLPGWSATRQETCSCRCSCYTNSTAAPSPSLDASASWFAWVLSWVWPLLGVTLAGVASLAQLICWISRQCCSHNTVTTQVEQQQQQQQQGLVGYTPTDVDWFGDSPKSDAAVASLVRAQLEFLKDK